MKARTYAALDACRGEFRALVDRLSAELPHLARWQEQLRQSLGYDDYAIETPVVYNRALDELGPRDSFRFILVADNPGKKEQLTINNRYLVGQSGKLAEGYFKRELGVDFRKEVVILNKTPIHTPKTAEIRKLLAAARAENPKAEEALRRALESSQVEMAAMARRLHGASEAVLWISGYGELGPRGLFAPYARAIAEQYADAPKSLIERVWLFRHFSMNQFAIEVKQKTDPAKPIMDELKRIGIENRERVLGF